MENKNKTGVHVMDYLEGVKNFFIKKCLRMTNILVKLLFYFLLSCQDKDCVFDPTQLNPNKYRKNPNFDFVQWNNQTKVANILTQRGDFLSIKRCACTHYGQQAHLVVFFPDKEVRKEYWIDKLLWLSKQVLNEYDDRDLKNIVLQKKNWDFKKKNADRCTY